MIHFQLATAEDALTISSLRKAIWNTTYRGIYDDTMIDGYDVAAFAERDKVKIVDVAHKAYIIVDNDVAIGYLIFSVQEPPQYKDYSVCLHSLYVLESYQHSGIGTQAMTIVADYCKNIDVDKFYCQCNAHNAKAIEFYKKKGGVIGQSDVGNGNKAEDAVWFEFICN